jgi:tetratricopeptide (TPR) repeat protein
MFKRALEGREYVLGLEHQNTLQTVHSLGVFYDKQGEIEKAETMYKRALEGRERALGLEHQETLNSLHCLSRVYTEQGKNRQADALYIRAGKTELTSTYRKSERASESFKRMPGIR